MDTGNEAIEGLFSSSSSRRYGRKSLKGFRGSGAASGAVIGSGTGGGEGRRTERSIGSEAGSGTGICTDS